MHFRKNYEILEFFSKLHKGETEERA